MGNLGWGTRRPFGAGAVQRLFAAAVVAATLWTSSVLTPSTAEAQYGPPPRQQLYYQSTTFGRLNPLGLISRIQLQYRHRLYEHDSLALQSNHIGVGFYGQFSPAFARGGPRIELKPASVLVLYASYELVGFYGTFEFLNSYNSPAANFSDSAQDTIRDRDENYATTGTELTLGALLQAKVGPVAARINTRLVHGNYSLQGAGPFYYDPTYDALLEDQGWMVTSDFDLLYLHGDHITAGARYTHLSPLYDGGDNNRIDRLGFVLAYTFFKEDQARINGPTILLLTQWHLQHRWRTGADTSQALPQIILGFDFRGDLLAD